MTRWMSGVLFLVWMSFVPYEQNEARRIISLVPAVTEMLFAIGVGDRVVGVSSYDQYPKAVGRLPRVGALLDPNLERVLSLRPDLVVVYHSHVDLQHQLTRGGIATFTYKHGGLQDVFATMLALGTRVNATAPAEQLVKSLKERLGRIAARVSGRPRPRAVLVFGRQPGSLRNVYASGSIGFLHDALELAGAANVFGDVARESLQVSSEQLLAKAPDVIVELAGENLDVQKFASERQVWDVLASIPAVRTGRVYLIRGEELVTPGPRIVDGIEALARTIHLGAFAERD